MRTRAVAAGVIAVGLAVSGCGASDEDRTAELRQYLADHHQFDQGYDGLGVVSVAGGDVMVALGEWHSPDYGAYLACDWVSEWLYLSDVGDTGSRVVVTVDGETVLERRGQSETCEAAGFRAEYGT
jgi:hypothetical protein